MIGTIERPSFVIIMVCRFLCNETLGTFRQLLSESRTRILNKRAIAKWKWRHYFFCINDTLEIFKNNYYRFCKNLQKQYLPCTLFIVCNVKCRNFGEFTSLPNLLCLFTVFLCSQSDTHVLDVCNVYVCTLRTVTRYWGCVPGVCAVCRAECVAAPGHRALDTPHTSICTVTSTSAWSAGKNLEKMSSINIS